MKKTATREEVERVFKEHSSEFTFEGADKMILNEIFGEPYEPKAGDWVVRESGKVSEIESIHCTTVDFKDGTTDSLRTIERPATEEEIKRAQWKEGEIYEVWHNDDADVVPVAFSSANYGRFKSYKGDKKNYKWDNFKRIVQC